MKKNLILFFFTFSKLVFACSCLHFGTPFDEFSSSDLVADVTIEKVYPAEKKFEKQYYKVDLKYHKIYKGTPAKSMYVSGTITVNNKRYGSFTSCSLGFEPGQRLTIFENRDKNGLYVLHYCSKRIMHEPQYNKSIDYGVSQKILSSIAKYDIPTNFKNLYIDFNFDVEKRTTALDIVKGLAVKNRFAIYEITANKDGNIENVEVLQNFLSESDNQILGIIRKSEIKLNSQNINKINTGEKFLFILYYYPSEKNQKSFVSQHYL